MKWFSVEKGFGFIVPDDGGADVFCHQVRTPTGARATQTQIYAPGFRSLAEGEPVEFKRMEFNGRIQASDVTGPDGSYVQGTLPPSQDANKDDF